MDIIQSIREKHSVLSKLLDERNRRMWAACEAKSLGRGGVARVAEATGMSRTTITAAMREMKDPSQAINSGSNRVRRVGGGRKPITEKDPTLLHDLEKLVEPLTRGDPESPLRWTCKSTRKLAKELNKQGHKIGDRKVAQLLHKIGYSLQANVKTKEISSHPDRDEQFKHINKTVKRFQKKKLPVISVDAKKKELVGNFKNGGKEWRPRGKPEEVLDHDFPDKTKGKGLPYGVYDVTHNEGWVSVGVDHDTSEFAVESIKRWWRNMGSRTYSNPEELLIIADSGGSNASRSRLWKKSLQDCANKIGLKISVCHFPPGTSKWNKIEHRMFSHISMNWRGKPLTSHEVMVNLIANTTTRKGLSIKAKLDKNEYATGKKVSKEEFKQINVRPSRHHGDWNYTISPR